MRAIHNSMHARQLTVLDDSLAAVFDHLDLQALCGQRIFITGGTGFFGLWLLSALARARAGGVDIAVTALSRNPARFLARHPQFEALAWLDFIEGDVRSFTLQARQFDLLIHGAVETSTAANAAQCEMFDTITSGMRHVTAFAASAGVRRMLLLSSGAVYGPQPPNTPLLAEDSLAACSTLQTGSAYGEGKRVMEWMGAMAQQQHSIEVVLARCFAFSGPGLPLDGHFAIGNFIRDALYGDTIKVRGDGSAMRSYLYGADLAVWLLQLLMYGKPLHAYHVGSDQAISIGALATRVRDLLAPAKPVIFQNKTGTENQARNYYVPATERGRRELGLQAWTDLDCAVHFTAAYAQTWQERNATAAIRLI